jgi:hypothetical protein
MAQRLKSNPAISRLAADLNLRSGPDPAAAILRHCRKKIEAFLNEIHCDTLDQLLDLATAKLDTVFIELHTDEDLRAIESTYLARREAAFVDLAGQLGPDVYAITYGLINPGKLDRRFVSLIDCRGSKKYRQYFSKWHELAHLLTLTRQMRLRFCRTHTEPTSLKDPEEALMDVIAGDLGFFPPIVHEHAFGRLSFEKIEKLRAELCPGASRQAAEIGIVKAWPRPVLWVHARLATRKEDRVAGFDFHTPTSMALRAVKVTINDAAKTMGILLPPNMRVPERSAIYRTYMSGEQQPVAMEDLSWWESRGVSRPPLSIHVEARACGEFVDALLTT